MTQELLKKLQDAGFTVSDDITDSELIPILTGYLSKRKIDADLMQETIKSPAVTLKELTSALTELAKGEVSNSKKVLDIIQQAIDAISTDLQNENLSSEDRMATKDNVIKLVMLAQQENVRSSQLRWKMFYTVVAIIMFFAQLLLRNKFSSNNENIADSRANAS